nr:MAG TPA: hypothetical protein [Caudoviricetes sp.]
MITSIMDLIGNELICGMCNVSAKIKQNLMF